MRAVMGDHTACIQALVAAKAALNIADVNDARFFACLVTLELPSISKSHKHLLKLVSCAVVCELTVVSLLSLVFG